MKKRVLSLLLAVLVLVAALPIGMMVSADDAGKYNLEVVNSKLANDFSATANADLQNAPGISDLAAYAVGEGTTVAADNEALKITDASNGKAYILVKNWAFDTANALSFYMDTTGVEADFTAKFYINLGVAKSEGADTERVLIPGKVIYFVDAETEVVETITVAEGNLVTFKADTKGTYYIPDEAIENSTVEGAWTSLSQWKKADAGYTTWVMGNNNNGLQCRFTISDLTLGEDDAIIFDTLSFAEINVTEKVFVVKVENEKVINDFSATANDNLYDGGGVSAGLDKYVAVSGDLDVAHDAAADAVKITGKASTGAQNTIELRLKALSFDGANMLSFTIDATDIANDPDVDTDDYLWARPCFSFAANKSGNSDVARYYAGGVDLYFVPDGGEAVETLAVGTASSEWNVRIPIKTGVKGTYYIVDKAFQATTVTDNGYELGTAIPSGAWTSFSDEYMTSTANDWYMDANNGKYANFMFQMVAIPEGKSIIIDDLKYVEGAVVEKTDDDDDDDTPAGPTYVDWSILNTKVVNNFPTEANTLNDYANDTGVTLLDNYAKAVGATVAYDSATGSAKFSGATGSDGYVVAFIKGTSTSDTTMLGATIDATNVTGDADGIFWVKMGASWRTVNSKLIMAEKTLYFKEDGQDKIIELKADINGNVPIQAGKKGIYMFPASSLESNAVFTEFSDGWLTGTEWIYDPTNQGNTYIIIRNFELPNGEYMLIDDVAYFETGEPSEGPKPFPYMNSGLWIDVSKAATLIEEGKMGAWGNITPENNFDTAGGKLTVSFPPHVGNNSAMSFYGNKPADDDLAIAFTIDASGVSGDFNVRLCMGYGDGGYRNTGGGAYYLVPADGSEWIKGTIASEQMTIPAGFKGLFVVPFESFQGGTGSDNPLDVSIEKMQAAEKLSVSWYFTNTTTANNKLVISKISYMKENDGSVVVPDTGVESYVVIAVAMMVAAVLAAVVSLKKKAIEL